MDVYFYVIVAANAKKERIKILKKADFYRNYNNDVFPYLINNKMKVSYRFSFHPDTNTFVLHCCIYFVIHHVEVESTHEKEYFTVFLSTRSM